MRYLMDISYDGSAYEGWQRQPHGCTIEDSIEQVLSHLLATPTLIYGAGRTDTGVHALHQKAHFDCFKPWKQEKLRYAINELLPEDIHINELKEVADDFHARHAAHGKYYRYVYHVGENNPFTNRFSARLKQWPDLIKIETVLPLFLGRHRFINFTVKKEDQMDYFRTISTFSMHHSDHELIFDVIGSGFMHYQVRMMVGALIAYGSGKLKSEALKAALSGVDGADLNYKAPAAGLILMEVIYDSAT